MIRFEGSLDKSRIQDVMFNPRLAGEATENELLSTTPADLANTDKLSWKYIIKNGEVWKISSKYEADTILR